MIRPIALWRRCFGRMDVTDHLGRDAKDFAIEHAGYLADAVERVLKVERSILDAEDWLDLNSRVYEFRKRAARASRPIAFCAGLALASAAQAQSLPFPAFTPGAVYYTNKEQACAFDRSTPRLSGAAYRETARYVFELYGIPYAQHRNYELDHLIPRCLGGADTVANLWPQPLPEALKKDRRWEIRICRAVCRDGTVSIEDGQSFFRSLKWSEQ
jgi:hypothetical protein